jgi:hypothetical protein
MAGGAEGARGILNIGKTYVKIMHCKCLLGGKVLIVRLGYSRRNEVGLFQSINV